LKGNLELLTGVPGLGKSQVQISYIACVTTGNDWPDGSPGCKPANVIMLTAEDTLDTEVAPRLIAAGADISKVFALKCIKTDQEKRQFLLGDDLEELKKLIKEIGDVGLVTIDPITAYMGKIDSHKTTDVRGQLGPLKDLAEETNVAFSAITHPPKVSSQQAIDHFIGSQAFIAAGRIGHVCVPEMTKESEETGRILFTHAKHNSSERMQTWAYHVEIVPIGEDDDRKVLVAPMVKWDDEPVELTANQAIEASRDTDSAQGRCQGLILDSIKDGPAPVNDVDAAAKMSGFTLKQVRTAKDKLRREIVAYREGGVGGTWMLRQREKTDKRKVREPELGDDIPF
jgi:putative DNA primase/helicase